MNNIRRYVGLSLSFCMQDILRNRVEVDKIAAIVTSTRFGSINEAFEQYFLVYWSEYADDVTCKSALEAIWPLVCQPRVNFDPIHHRGHMISHGFWLDTYTGELKKHLL